MVAKVVTDSKEVDACNHTHHVINYNSHISKLFYEFLSADVSLAERFIKQQYDPLNTTVVLL